MTELTKSKDIAGLVKVPYVKEKIESLMGSRATQFVSTLIQLTNNNKLLAKADPMTVLSASMVSASLDLPIQPSLGFAYIVPYKGQAQFQIGYKGLIQLAQRSGQFRFLNDCVIEKGRLISYNELTGELKIDWDKEPEKGNPDGYAVYFELINGFSKVVFWSYDKVKDHASKYSQAFRSGYDSPWKSDFDKMALKTVIKYALQRYAPLSVEMERAVTADQAVVDEHGNPMHYPDNKKDDATLDAFTVSSEESEPLSDEGL